MKEIRFFDLTLQYRNLRAEMDEVLQHVLQRGHFILGQQVRAFEEDFAAFLGVKHAVGVASGTDALQLALRACGATDGAEVITSAWAPIATVAAIELAGARPVLVDIDPGRYTLDPQRVLEAVTARTRALIPIHLYGCPADLQPLLEIARAHDLSLIEDCAQAHGARYRERRVGSWGTAGAFSFYPTKNLGAYGDGGAVVTDDARLAERLRALRQYGWDDQRTSQTKGMNSRLDELQAAILGLKLSYLESWNADRRRLAELYRLELKGSSLVLPPAPAGSEPVHHLFVVRHPERDALRLHLAARGIQSMVHYPRPPHLHPAYADLGYRPGDFPEAERASREVLSLPIWPEMDNHDVSITCVVILEFLKRRHT